MRTIKHGTLSGYVHGKCRCADCLTRVREYRRGRRAAAAARPHPQLTARDLGLRPFQTPRCARCRRPCQDGRGEPRWVIAGDMKILCERCGL